MATSTLGTLLTKGLREQIQQGSITLLQTMSPVYQFILNSTRNVSGQDAVGRDWTWKRPVNDDSLAGAGKFRPVDPSAQWAQNAGVNGRPAALAVVQSFPGHSESTFVGLTQYSVQLMEYLGNMFLPNNLLRANQLSAMAVDIVGMNIKGVIKRKARDELAMFYTLGAGTIGSSGPSNSRYLGRVGASPTAGTTSDSTCTFSPVNGRVNMFPLGTTVSQFNNAGSELNAAKLLTVLAVDRVAKTITIGTIDGTNFADAWTGSATTGDYLTIRGSASYGFAGFNDWIKDSGTIQGISLSDMPQLKSFVDGTLQVLSEPLLNKYVGAFCDAYGPEIDTLVTTTGVLNKYVDNLRAGFGISGATTSPYQIDRTNSPVKVVAGFAGIDYIYAGKKITIWADPNCQNGYAYLFKAGQGNIKRVTPPMIPGQGGDGQFGNEVQFQASIDGGSIWKNYHVQDSASQTHVQTSDVKEAPFSAVYNYVIEQPQGIKFTNLQEDIA